MPPSQESFFSDSFLRRLERLTMVYRRAANSQTQGERRSSRRGHSVEFADFRPYTIGDDFRRIDWNVYARLERLFIKLFLDEEEITLHLLIDNSPSMNWGDPNKLEYAARAAAAVGYIALVGLDRVAATALFPIGNASAAKLSPVRGRRSAIKLFEFFQSIFPPSEHGLDFQNILPELPVNHAIILFSDLMGDAWQRTVNQLRGRGHEVTVAHILSPDEVNPAFNGDFRLIDSETSEEVEITADVQTLERYTAHIVEWQSSWMKQCRARQITYLPITSALPLEDLLFSTLPAQGLLR